MSRLGMRPVSASKIVISGLAGDALIMALKVACVLPNKVPILVRQVGVSDVGANHVVDVLYRFLCWPVEEVLSFRNGHMLNAIDDEELSELVVNPFSTFVCNENSRMRADLCHEFHVHDSKLFSVLVRKE